MRTLLTFLVCVFMWSSAHGQGTTARLPLGDSCAIAWDANAPGEEVTGYEVNAGGDVSATDQTEVECTEVGVDPTQPGSFTIEVRAVNQYGRSEPATLDVEFGAVPGRVQRVRIDVVVTVRQR